ncbi:MAG TPA: hypothetical protein DEB61_00820 [Alcanivorax sp.]|nr:hypothetical protein [Alcanivorax sp.]HAD46386.1 hypothetical protein [Alcanivorax sp.]HAI35580.1 hypothetical protein [Alcanivorax sp.]HAI90199.1 hypothetical protein [Alcanivorax sp.]HBP69199.1 hypothetical protein [Alcanivorax sp.]|tara:strand:- start:4470 stop:4742 length:273 start_codon:yes stop_codon:yes gene_type:complete
MRGAGPALLSIALLVGCGESERWDATIYELENGREQAVDGGSFRTFEDCQASAVGYLRATGQAQTGTYICGLNCEYNSTYDTKVCETTRR